MVVGEGILLGRKCPTALKIERFYNESETVFWHVVLPGRDVVLGRGSGTWFRNVVLRRGFGAWFLGVVPGRGSGAWF